MKWSILKLKLKTELKKIEKISLENHVLERRKCSKNNEDIKEQKF